MKSCVAQCHYAGLFSLINKVAVCHSIYDHVHVDMSQGEGFIYGKENWWPELFATTEAPTGEHDTILYYPDHRLTGREAGNVYLSGNEWRDRFNTHWRKLRVNMDIEWRAALIAGGWDNRDAISVLVRCNGHRGEQLSDKTQALEEYAAAFERVAKPNSIMHVMCGDEESLQWFRDRFDVSWVNTTKRSPNRDGERHMTEPQTVEDAKQVLMEVLVLSMARALIHPVSNMATAALYINPQLESVYLQ